MSSLEAIKKTIKEQNKADAVKVEPNSADTSLVSSKEQGVLIKGSNATVGQGGFVTIQSGEPNRVVQAGDISIVGSDGYPGGDVLISGGENLNANLSGHVRIYTGGSDDTNVSLENTGSINLSTGAVGADTKTSGSVTLKTGSPHTHFNSYSGAISLETGGTSSTDSSGNSGSVFIKSGQGGVRSSGLVSLATGDTTTANSGAFYFKTGNATTANSGAITMGSGTTTTGSSGNIRIESGDVTVSDPNDPPNNGTSGIALLGSGDATGGMSGQAFLFSGSSATGSSGQVYVFSSNAGANSGAVSIRTGHSTINGNSGQIDLYTGNATLDPDSTGTISSGAISIFSGQGKALSGAISLYSGSAPTGGDTGSVSLYSGVATGGVSGLLELKTGNSVATQQYAADSTGAINIKTGFTPADGFSSGDITIATGGSVDVNGDPQTATNTDLANSGDVLIRTGNTYDVASGDITLKTGDTETTVGNGEVNILTGDRREDQRGGDIHIEAGDAYPETYSASGNSTIFANSIYIRAGSHKGSLTSNTAFRGGLVEINGGDADQVIMSAGSQWKGGDVRINGGTGSRGFGAGEDGEQGDIQLSGHNISITGNSNGGSTNDDGEIDITTSGGLLDINTFGGDVDINAGSGEAKLVSSSFPTDIYPNRLVFSQGDTSLLNQLGDGLQILGYGEITISTTDNSNLDPFFFYQVPISFAGIQGSNTGLVRTNGNASTYQVGLDNITTWAGSGTPTVNPNVANDNNHSMVIEWYKGAPIFDPSAGDLTGSGSPAIRIPTANPFHSYIESSTYVVGQSTYYVAPKLTVEYEVVSDRSDSAGFGVIEKGRAVLNTTALKLVQQDGTQKISGTYRNKYIMKLMWHTGATGDWQQFSLAGGGSTNIDRANHIYVPQYNQEVKIRYRVLQAR